MYPALTLIWRSLFLYQKEKVRMKPERSCASCEGFPERCPYGKNVFDEAAAQCLWADETECLIRGSTTASPSSTSETTTEKQTSEPSSTIVSTSSTSTSTESPSTTVQPTTVPTEHPTSPNPIPKPGDPCDPDICQTTGNCQSYLRCDRETGRLVQDDCGEELFWNPLNPDGTQQIHGGNCDFLDNLSTELQSQYRKDPECLACFWKVTEECSQEYLYQPPNQITRNVMTLACPQGLLFSVEKQTCQRCNDVKRTDGSTCCGGIQL